MSWDIIHIFAKLRAYTWIGGRDSEGEISECATTKKSVVFTANYGGLTGVPGSFVQLPQPDQEEHSMRHGLVIKATAL